MVTVKHWACVLVVDQVKFKMIYLRVLIYRNLT